MEEEIVILNLQAIKKVLSENFHEKEEIHPQILLYKNLWLEAEAALCSINYMARYNRIKMEMEQCKLDSAKMEMEQCKLDSAKGQNFIWKSIT